ncbi:AzgA purine transporter [Chloropicon primus]|uniref:AzgA purine transporter n=3 Tax=Chloropicon primus TaxID=1764295 RepID=A0A5B8MUV1_9CHLO|nr:AzgA purine transporter [Chloropicon primus]|eukprot:QDZ23180.1 AzgA purine transporter [Chloropicon primus]
MAKAAEAMAMEDEDKGGQGMALEVEGGDLEPQGEGMKPLSCAKLVGAWLWENMGIAFDFGHFNKKDPFWIKEKGSNWFTEIRAGLVTFLTMSYILPANAAIMAIAMGQDKRGDLVIATALVSAVASVLMGLMANFPLGVAPGMGLNAYFVFTVVLQKGLSWQEALTAVFVSGWLFLVTTVLGLRWFMLKLIPHGVQLALSAGIGLFLAFLGTQAGGGMGIIVGDEATLVRLNEPLSVEGNYDAHKMWISALVFTVTVVMMAMNVKGAPLVGIIFGTIIAWSECWAQGPTSSVLLYPFGSCSDVAANGLNGTECFCYAPEKVVDVPRVATAGKLSFDILEKKQFWISVVTFYFNDLLGCAGTLIAVTRKASIMDRHGNIPKRQANAAFVADSVSTILGSVLGTSTVTTYIESAAGIVDGGRTGVVAIVVGICFSLSIPFAPLLSNIPDLATGPIVVIVGAMMMTSVEGFEWSNVEDGLPAFLTLLLIPLTFNIAYGIIAGTIFWFIIQIFLIPYRLVKKEDPLKRLKSIVMTKP